MCGPLEYGKMAYFKQSYDKVKNTKWGKIVIKFA